MDVYEGNSIRVLKLGVRHPLAREELDRVNGFSSLQTGVLRVKRGKVVACPVRYKYSRAAEERGITLPLMSVTGVSEHEGRLLAGIRSGDVRFPNVMSPAPSGHVEFSLTPREAIELELHEELGVPGKPRLMGAQFTPLYFSLIYHIELESGEVNPSWEWSNLFWIQKEKLDEFLKKNGKLLGPGFAAPFLLYLHREGINPEPIARKNRWNIRFGKLKELEWSLRAGPEIRL